MLVTLMKTKQTIHTNKQSRRDKREETTRDALKEHSNLFQMVQ